MLALTNRQDESRCQSMTSFSVDEYIGKMSYF